MKVTKDSPIVADAYALFLAFGGRRHRTIEAAMRAKGYEKFNRRVFYDRLQRGRVSNGWIKRFGWKKVGSGPFALAGDPTRLRDAIVETSRQAAAPALAGGEKAEHLPTTPTTNSQPKRIDPNSPEHRRMEIKAFENWLKKVSPRMTWDWPHLKLLYSKLADVTSGKTKRLMIFMPPRHGKSELVTVHYPAYRLRRDPRLNIIVASYNQKLANRFSRKIRITWEDSQEKENGEVRIENDNHPAERHDRTRPQTAGNGQASDEQGSTSESGSDNSQSSHLNSQLPRRRLNTVAEWETGEGGGVRAVGVGAGITGYGGKLVIIDDPIKSRSEAESETYRNKTWEWFNDDLYTRLEPDARMILIQTRWHEDDLAGRLLEEMKNGGEQWEVVSLPAIAEDDPTAETQRRGEDGSNRDRGDQRDKIASVSPALSFIPCIPSIPVSSSSSVSAVQTSVDDIGRRPGDALCPERFDLDELARIRRQLGEYSFAALYQQRPMPLEGGLFKKKWFTHIVDAAPDGLRWIRGYDLAISTKTSADFTATARVAMDRNGVIYIADVIRARLEYPDQRKLVVDRLVNERDTEHCIEDALHAKAFIQDLRREPALARHAIRVVSVTNDKFTRALAWANRAEEGKIALVRGPWLKTFLDEVCSFPNAAHDDQVDAVSIAIQTIDRRRRQFWRF
jgi:predicted phage terminase large subunit-like protein